MQELSRSALNNLKFNKSSVLDNIPQWLLKDKWINSAAIVAKLLTKIINTFLVMGVVPGEEKYTKVTPVFVAYTKCKPHNAMAEDIYSWICHSEQSGCHIVYYRRR